MKLDDHVRHALLYCFQRQLSAEATFEEVNRTLGAGTVGRSTVYEWFAKYKAGNTTLEDNLRSGAPSKVNETKLKQLLEEDETLSTRVLANYIGV